MFTIVIFINCSIALICLGLAWFLVKLKPRLASITRSLEIAAKGTHGVLAPAPQAILGAQKGAQRSRLGYQNLEPKLQRAYQLLSLLNRLTFVARSPVIKAGKFGKRNRSRR